MAKKIFSILILCFSIFMPVFGISINLPWSVGTAQDFNVQNRSYGYNDAGEHNIYNLIKFSNSFLWWCFGIVCAALLIYSGFKLITSKGDSKAMKQALGVFVGTVVGILIAMLAYYIVYLIVNYNL